MKKYCFVFFIVWIAVTVSGCGKKRDIPVPPNKVLNNVNQQKAITFIDVIKSKKLADFQSKTIGDAFEGYKYFESKDWTMQNIDSGEQLIDFFGWIGVGYLDKELKDGSVKRGINVKIVIEKNGNFYVLMIKDVELKSDGRIVGKQLDKNTTLGVLSNIYSGKKINL